MCPSPPLQAQLIIVEDTILEKMDGTHYSDLIKFLELQIMQHKEEPCIWKRIPAFFSEKNTRKIDYKHQSRMILDYDYDKANINQILISLFYIQLIWLWEFKFQSKFATFVYIHTGISSSNDIRKLTLFEFPRSSGGIL